MNNIGEEVVRRESLLAYITIIPKEGKDKTNCSSYRPIALLNADTKLYAKILATRLKRLIPLWINPDQTGFVPGREGRDNSIKTILMLRKGKSSGSSTPRTPVNRCRESI